MKRRICIVTGSRAEYGLFKPLMEEIRLDNELELKLIVTGTHLSDEFGATYREIEKDEFTIDEKIDIQLAADDPAGITKSMGLAISNFTQAYKKLKPSLIVVLGDRFETFSACTSALISKIPVAHIGGGEVTEGALDDSMRHSITKMSHLHFTAMEVYRKRVIQLGENPLKVFTVGALGLDNIRRMDFLPQEELEKEIGFKFAKRNILTTFHPATLEESGPQSQLQALLDVLDSLKDTNLIFTKANADSGGKIINSMIDDYALKNSHKARVFSSMGQLKYLSTMRLADAVVGNSSSGIIETPSFNKGTINIGDRQKGRIRAESVIDCSPAYADIHGAFEKLYSKEFQDKLKSVHNPYGDGNTAIRIKKIIKGISLDGIVKKKFYDLV